MDYIEEEMTFDDLDMTAFNISNQNQTEEEIPGEEEVPSEEIENNEEITEEVIEEEVPEEVDDEDGDEETTGKQDDSSQSLYSTLASVLLEQEVLTSLPSDKKIETADDLVEAIRNEIKTNEYAGLNESQKEYLKALEVGIPEQVVQEHITTQGQLSDISKEEVEENSELRKQLILQDFRVKGYSEEKAERLTQRSIDIGEDITDALDALDALKEYDKKQYQKKLKEQEQLILQKEEEDRKQIESFKKLVFETKELIPGVPITPKVAQRVYDRVMKPVATLENGQKLNALQKARMDDPLRTEFVINYLWEITKEGNDFSKLMESQKRKAINDLDKQLQNGEIKNQNIQTPNKNINNSWVKALDNLAM